MRRLITAVAACILLASCESKQDADVLHARPGLWETVVDDGQRKITRRVCSLNEVEQVRRLLEAPNPDGCTTTRERDGDAHVIRAVCPTAPAPEAEIRVSGSDTRREVLMTAVGPGQKTSVRAESRWLGPCPEGMKDGKAQQGTVEGRP